MSNKSTASNACDAKDIREFLFDRHCPHCTEFDEDKFLDNRHPPLFLIYSLMQRNLKQTYQFCKGDLVMALVMGEIWNFNIARYFARAGTDNATTILSDSGRRQALLPACNAYSISQVLGVPSETVRRKVRKLIELGWVERNADNELITTRQLEEFLTTEQTLDVVRGFVSTARHVLALIEKPAP